MNESTEALQAFLKAIEQLGDRFEQAAAQSPSLQSSSALVDAAKSLRESFAIVASVHRKDEERQARDQLIDASSITKPAPKPVPQPRPTPSLEPHFGQRAKEELFRQFGAPVVAASGAEPNRLTFSDWTNSSRELLLSASVSRSSPADHKPASAEDDSRQRTRQWFDKAMTTLDDK